MGGKSDSGEEKRIPEEHLERLASALQLAREGQFDAAMESLPGSEALAAIASAAKQLIKELQTNIEKKERVFADLQLAHAEIEEQMTRTVRDQQAAIQELSTPVIEIWKGVLALPIIGTVDTQRALAMTEQLLQRVAALDARCVVIDLTGVDVVDSMTANHIIKMSKAAQLLGTFCVITGIGPLIAQTLVDLGIELGGVRTLRSMKDGLRACLAYVSRAEITAAADMDRSESGDHTGREKSEQSGHEGSW